MVFVGVDLKQHVIVGAKLRQRLHQLARRALHTRNAQRRHDHRMGGADGDMGLGPPQRVVDQPAAVGRAQFFREVDRLRRAGAGHQSNADIGSGAMHRIGLFPIDDGEIVDRRKTAAQRFEEHPFGRYIGQFGIEARLQRNPDAPPDLRRLAAGQFLSEGLAEMGVRVDEAGHDRPARQIFDVGIRVRGPKVLQVADKGDFAIGDRKHAAGLRTVGRQQQVGRQRIGARFERGRSTLHERYPFCGLVGGRRC